MTGPYCISIYPPTDFNYYYRFRLKTLTLDSTLVARDHRDIVLVSSADGGLTWSGKTRVNDSPPRFDDSFPQIIVDSMGNLHATWYDRRDDPCGDPARTYYSWS